MATLIKGILSFNLDWQFVLVGVFIAVTLNYAALKRFHLQWELIFRCPPHFRFLLVVLLED